MLNGFSGIKNRNTKGKRLGHYDESTPEGRARHEQEKAMSFRKREEKRSKKGNRVRAGKIEDIYDTLKLCKIP